ncbi:MAG TPA: thioredoxin [Bacteroidales bacterium]|nr:thioredoxin [Bacteroidales bacterium]
MKSIFLIGMIFKTFFLTSISLGHPSGAEGYPSKLPASEVTIIHLTEESFKQLVFDYENNKEWKYEGTKPAIIDFYADWCAPCRQLSPIVEDLAKEYSGKIIVYKVDTEKERRLAQNIGISALPTLLFVPVKGKPQVSMGALPKETLKKAIADVLLVR